MCSTNDGKCITSVHSGLKRNLLKGNKSLKRKKKKAQYLESQFCLICQKKKKKSKRPRVDIVIMYILYNMKENRCILLFHYLLTKAVHFSYDLQPFGY